MDTSSLDPSFSNGKYVCIQYASAPQKSPYGASACPSDGGIFDNDQAGRK